MVEVDVIRRVGDARVFDVEAKSFELEKISNRIWIRETAKGEQVCQEYTMDEARWILRKIREITAFEPPRRGKFGSKSFGSMEIVVSVKSNNGGLFLSLLNISKKFEKGRLAVYCPRGWKGEGWINFSAALSTVLHDSEKRQSLSSSNWVVKGASQVFHQNKALLKSGVYLKSIALVLDSETVIEDWDSVLAVFISIFNLEEAPVLRTFGGNRAFLFFQNELILNRLEMVTSVNIQGIMLTASVWRSGAEISNSWASSRKHVVGFQGIPQNRWCEEVFGSLLALLSASFSGFAVQPEGDTEEKVVWLAASGIDLYKTPHLVTLSDRGVDYPIRVVIPMTWPENLIGEESNQRSYAEVVSEPVLPVTQKAADDSPSVTNSILNSQSAAIRADFTPAVTDSITQQTPFIPHVSIPEVSVLNRDEAREVNDEDDGLDAVDYGSDSDNYGSNPHVSGLGLLSVFSGSSNELKQFGSGNKRVANANALDSTAISSTATEKEFFTEVGAISQPFEGEWEGAEAGVVMAVGGEDMGDVGIIKGRVTQAMEEDVFGLDELLDDAMARCIAEPRELVAEKVINGVGISAANNNDVNCEGANVIKKFAGHDNLGNILCPMFSDEDASGGLNSKKLLREKERWERYATRLRDRLRVDDVGLSSSPLPEGITLGDRILFDGVYIDKVTIFKKLIPPPRAKKSRLTFQYWKNLVGRPLLIKMREAGIDIDLNIYGDDSW